VELQFGAVGITVELTGPGQNQHRSSSIQDIDEGANNPHPVNLEAHRFGPCAMRGFAHPFLAAKPTALAPKSVYTDLTIVYTAHMTKRLVDIDEEALDAARSQLGTTTIKATVNEALRLVGSDRSEAVRNSMDVLSAMPLSDRDDAWR